MISISEAEVIQKFGLPYVVNKQTFVMGFRQKLAKVVLARYKNHYHVLDACCGAGFAAIELAKVVNKVTCIDINEDHIKLAKMNAETAGHLHKIAFILGDSTSEPVLQKAGNFDAAFLDMDWSKSDNKREHVTKMSQMVPAADVLFDIVSKFTTNIALRLPKEFDISELSTFPDHEIQAIYENSKLKMYMAYFGDLIQEKGNTTLSIDN